MSGIESTLVPDDSKLPICEQTAEVNARLLTWNINGLRKVAASQGGLKPLLDQFKADIVEHDLARPQGYHCFFTHCQVQRKPSYSGVATFVRSVSGLRTLACTTSLRDAQFFGSPGPIAGELSAERLVEIDAEGRVLVTDHGHFVLFNVYAPCISSGDEDEKTDERRSFKRDFLALLESRISQAREQGRGVVLVGDLNACATQLDHGYIISDSDFLASQWSKWIREILGLDSPDLPRLVDCFRRLHPDRQGAFTCWNTKTGARENNYGTRIDYIIVDTDLADRALRSCDIVPSFLGSDHCPVRADFLLPSVQPPGTTVTNGPRCGANEAGRNCGRLVAAAVGSADSSEAPKWPEHPPECSCFYRELKGKQEKLATYFVTGATNAKGHTAASSNNQKGEEIKEAEPSRYAVGGSVGAAANVFGGGPKRAQKGIMESLFSHHKPSLKRSGSTAGRAPSGGKDGNGRSAGARQSKLAFASNKQVVGPTTPTVSTSITGSSSSRETAALVAEKAAEAQGGHTPAGFIARGLHGDCDQGSALSFTSTSALADAGDGDGDGRNAQDSRGRRAHTDPVSSRRESTCASAKSSCNGGGSSNREKSAEAWKALFGQKKATPPCEHGEPSIQRTVLKQGANHNRRFYTCARSAGNWPSDRNARCNFFQWRLDGVRGYKDRPSREDSGKRHRRA